MLSASTKERLSELAKAAYDLRSIEQDIGDIVNGGTKSGQWAE
jgi:hypothetical protein